MLLHFLVDRFRTACQQHRLCPITAEHQACLQRTQVMERINRALDLDDAGLRSALQCHCKSLRDAREVGPVGESLLFAKLNALTGPCEGR